MQVKNVNLHSLIDPNTTVLIGWNHVLLLLIIELHWLVSKDANETIVVHFHLDGQVSAHWLKDIIRNSFVRGDAYGGSTL